MGWKGVTIMDQRVRFIAEYIKDYFPFSELCLQFNISRKTGYKWVERYEEEGPKGLADHSRRPHSCPHCTDQEIIDALVRSREKHPTWGPKKLLHILSHGILISPQSQRQQISSRERVSSPILKENFEESIPDVRRRMHRNPTISGVLIIRVTSR